MVVGIYVVQSFFLSQKGFVRELVICLDAYLVLFKRTLGTHFKPSVGKWQSLFGLTQVFFGFIAELMVQVVNLQAELSYLQAHLTTLELPVPLPPPPPPPAMGPQLSIADLPSASSIPATYDLSSLFDPMAQAAWMVPQRQIDFRQFEGSCGGGGSSAAGGGDLNALARELLRRQGSPPPGCIDAMSSPSSLSKWDLTTLIYTSTCPGIDSSTIHTIAMELWFSCYT